MQPRNLPFAEVPDDGLPADVAVPQAVASRTTALNAETILTGFNTLDLQ
jgi:hypothetical protein